MKNNFKELRESLKLSQSQFANKFNMPVKTIQSWESGIRNPPKYVLIMMLRICELEAEIAEISDHIKNRLYETAFNSVNPDESLLIEDIAESIDFWISEPRKGAESND